MTHRHLSYFLACLSLSHCAYKDQRVDLIVHNGTIHTLDGSNDRVEAMAIRDGRIIELGAERQIMNRYRADRTVDLAGRIVFPGFIDGHCHFLGYGLNKQKVDLTGTRTWDEVVQRTRAFADAHPEKEWIMGRGWDQNDWPMPTEPDNDRLNALFPDRPVLLQRVDGHAAVVNQAAMDRAGLDPDRSIEGGMLVERDGRPTGLLIDNAVSVFQQVFDQADEATKRRALLDAQQDCVDLGLTMVVDAGLDTGTIALMERMQQSGELKIRIYAMVRDDRASLAHFERTGLIITDRLVVRAIKVYADGALGSRGALLKQPYTDRPDLIGLQLAPTDHFADIADWCMANGFQMATHCIGDSANSLVLRTYAEKLGGTNDRRWRIEHAQVIDPEDIDLFGKYGIIPSVQPTHATSDAPWAEARLGPDRIRTAYAYAGLSGQLGLLALGTDFPVEAIDPLGTFRSAVFRVDAEGRPHGGYRMEEALSDMQALRGMTIWNAIATFTENDLGSLEAGKWADFVVLDQDLIGTTLERLSRTHVTATFIAGEQVDR
ncbi:MAG: amidohydrolase [Flavobacteriales bacterium]|nr:amidohydrolase [Flavobacteriales bacterium]